MRDKKTQKRQPKLKILRTVGYSVVLFGWIVLGLLMSRNLQILLSSHMEGMTATFQVIEYIFNAIIIIGVPVFVYYGLGRGSVKSILRGELESSGVNKPPKLSDIPWSIAGLIATLVLSSWALLIISNQLTWLGLNQDLRAELISNIDLSRYIPLFVTIVIVAPLSEELIFRGWMYGRLRKVTDKGLRGAILPTILVSLIFGFAHGHVTIAIVTAIMSICFCIMREYTGSIWAGTMSHMLKNLVAFIIIFH